MRVAIILVFLAALSGCVRVPAGVSVVDGFELERYLGRWYEIARLDHPFERGLIAVTADYSLGEGGAIEVLNRGYDPAKERWKEARGRAYPVGAPGEGRLKVSFFGPFYGAYNIIALDHAEYSYALVSGPSRNYLWILAREPRMEPALLAELVGQADRLGFVVDELIFVEH
ncbi:lipocalin family protein [Geoalkalibacter halelectricus]|uniref:Lipocalin family protein n=1 Tax=Geoalkalibacter halelectricus TaxID=2847045 RepID=A0ABY5ZLM6_9BACT|nr:lipocalin family protein [Geoalkalibacter halelectricus]MDO3379050.1 lipocalin family protein [Geoalkalibacter halelectricus]UWZ78862.1 lipocalin family protein [Geoalkalibacter halelectricus]